MFWARLFLYYAMLELLPSPTSTTLVARMRESHSIASHLIHAGIMKGGSIKDAVHKLTYHVEQIKLHMMALSCN